MPQKYNSPKNENSKFLLTPMLSQTWIHLSCLTQKIILKNEKSVGSNLVFKRIFPKLNHFSKYLLYWAVVQFEKHEGQRIKTIWIFAWIISLKRGEAHKLKYFLPLLIGRYEYGENWPDRKIKSQTTQNNFILSSNPVVCDLFAALTEKPLSLQIMEIEGHVCVFIDLKYHRCLQSSRTTSFVCLMFFIGLSCNVSVSMGWYVSTLKPSENVLF